MKPALVVLTAIAITLPTLSHAASRAEQRRACRSDAMRLCREFVPSASRVQQCMERKFNQLTPACQLQFGRG